MNYVMKKFEHLSRKANTVLNKTFDCREVEPIYVEILNLIKANPSSRKQFAKALLSILDGKNAPWELIQFCMRELQWQEVKDELEKKIYLAEDPRVIAVLQDILAVYEIRWDHADLYEYYSKEKIK
jgi:hypothetical protein